LFPRPTISPRWRSANSDVSIGSTPVGWFVFQRTPFYQPRRSFHVCL
jgi:hypothetical protein